MHVHIKFLQNIDFLFTYVLSFQIHFLKLYYYLYWINENEVNYPAHFVCHKISLNVFVLSLMFKKKTYK